MLLEGAYGTFSGIASVYVCGYELISDLPGFLNGTRVFGADLIINNLEIALVDSQSEAVHYGVVVCNAILVLLGLKGGNKDGVGVAMISSQNVLITAAILDGESPSVVYVDL